ncbi:YccF domain-containing protein [Cellulomonas sp.]|uniref:YccF domain-containing protein n=1 Tax=Cellulomonas sp. TaxID=40001 RepID=UPI003BAD9CD5
MKTLLNIIWLVLAGFWLALGYVLAGIICCILIVTIPFGIASFRMASYALWPFGRTVVDKPTAGAWSVIGNVIWVIVAGWWLALMHIITGIAEAITIVGIPLALANWKMVPISLFPLGKQIVPSDRIMAAYGQ